MILGERYQLQDPIGRDDMATIYRGWDIYMDRIVTIKMLRENHKTIPEFVARFQRRAEMASTLQHPNIAQVYDYGQTNGNYFMVKAGEDLITEDDIRSYFTTHEFALGPTVSGEPPTVVDIKCMTCKECSDMLHTWITAVDSRPVCYVKLRGPFLLTRMSMPPPRDGGYRPVSTVEYGEEVFDAVRGNPLMGSPGATV